MSCPLYIDDRAGSRDLLEYLPSDTESCRLDFGDAMILGNGPSGPVTVGVEVKSISDLLSSANTGRLAGHQLPGMLELFDVPWLLYFGSYRPGKSGELQVLRITNRGPQWQNFRIGIRPVPYGYLESFLLDVYATGVRIKHVYNAEEAAAWLKVSHRWWSKEWKDHHGLKQFDHSKDLSLLPGLDPDKELIARAIALLPGLGFHKAAVACHHFGSMGAMLGATWEDWARIPGIGKVLAKEAVRAINGR